MPTVAPASPIARTRLRLPRPPAVTGSLAATIASVAPGASGTLSFLVAVPAGQPIGLIPNSARFCYNDGSVQVPPACTTGSGGNIGTTGTATNTATYNVVQSFSVRLDDSGPGGAAPVSTTDAGAANDDTILVNAADQGSVVQFENIVTNTGNGVDTFNMTVVSNTFPAGTTFTFYNATNSAPLTDTNGDGIPDTGTLAASASTRVWVRAQLPPNATGNGANFQVVKRATSVGNSGVGDNTTDVLGSINRRTIDLTNTSAGGPGSGFQATGEAAAVTTNSTNPGTSTNFQLVIANAGPGADNFDLVATSNNTGINTASPTTRACGLVGHLPARHLRRAGSDRHQHRQRGRERQRDGVRDGERAGERGGGDHGHLLPCRLAVGRAVQQHRALAVRGVRREARRGHGQRHLQPRAHARPPASSSRPATRCTRTRCATTATPRSPRARSRSRSRTTPAASPTRCGST